MKTITYTNNQGLELKINKFASGAFSLTFNNGAHSFCDTMTELRTILLKNGMTRKWAANVKDRFDPLTEEHVLIDRYRTPGGSEMEVFITSRILFVNMIGTATHKRSSRTSSREITFRNVDHIHESSANQIGRSNYGGRVSVNPQSGNEIKKAENRTHRSIH